MTVTPTDVRSWSGYRAHTRARSTGTLVVLVDGYEQGVTSADCGEHRWVLICDPHGGILECETQAEARPWMSAPEEWCPDCATQMV